MQLSKFRPLWRFFGKYKYLLISVFFVSLIVFLDENSLLHSWEYKMQIRDLQSEIERYQTQYERDSAQLYELKHNPQAIRKVARERHFMKADNEDIFVLSDDNKQNEKKDATVK